MPHPLAAGRSHKPSRERKRKTFPVLRVRPLIADARRGQLIAGPLVIRCALGRSGIATVKREGDGASPRGLFRLREVFYRPDHLTARPPTGLPIRATRPYDGWCDAPLHRRYNRPVTLPCPGMSAEEMWRGDGLYDLVVDIDYNRGPIRPGRGSAIFLHVARPGYPPTEGCVALARSDLLRLLRRLGPRTRLRIG
ncbi:MAG: L,D-transpeptidase family protein [Methylobacterium sp.]|uniref:L,D-transpeptidase family protein n=1 Tax=Methylobacterium sp. TaxID=409 RepID=UPI0025F9B445|nr:L,D-transpeptidase family protein [Methylobacterium sp.]MBX9933881.1 L,D-transpeptidase family protein [Methylobacterium sp.]